MHFILRYFVIPLKSLRFPYHITKPDLEISVPNIMPLKYISLCPVYLRENPRPEIN